MTDSAKASDGKSRSEPALSANVGHAQVGGSTAARDAWVDVAKGMAIILVVLFHSIIFMNDVGLAGPWMPSTGVLDSFRMPLFFFASGLFAAKAIALSFKDLFKRRVANLLWLYFFWSIVWAAAFLVIPVQREPNPLSPLQQVALLPVWPNVSTWFVYALAVFFVVGWLIRRWPVWIQIAATCVLSVLFATNLINSGNGALDKMGSYFVFFLAAVNLGPQFRVVLQRIRPWQVFSLLAIYGVLIVLAARSGVTSIPGVKLFLGALGVIAGCGVALLVSRLQAFDWLRKLGTRTLPVYLLHFYPILVLAAALAPFSSRIDVVAVCIPPVLTVIAILLSLGVFRLTSKVPGLFAIPRSLISR